MNKFIAYCFILFSPFWVEQALAQDSTFITDRYKWELGVGLNSRNDNANPFSILLKKHVSSKIAWRYGMGINYDSDFEKKVPVIEDYDTRKIFIAYEIDRKSSNLEMLASFGIQNNHTANLLNIYYSIDVVLNYQSHRTDLPNGIQYFDVRLPDSTSITTAKYFSYKKYGIALRPSLGLQYSISRRLSVSLEMSTFYQVAFNWKQDFYYYLASESANQIGYGFVRGIRDKNWSYHLNAGLIPLLIFNYHLNHF